MKKLTVLVSVLFLFPAISCGKMDWEKTEPIEKYQDGKSVVLYITNREYNSPSLACARLRLKNKDSVYEIVVPAFDAISLKIGDTLKSK